MVPERMFNNLSLNYFSREKEKYVLYWGEVSPWRKYIKSIMYYDVYIFRI